MFGRVASDPTVSRTDRRPGRRRRRPRWRRSTPPGPQRAGPGVGAGRRAGPRPRHRRRPAVDHRPGRHPGRRRTRRRSRREPTFKRGLRVPPVVRVRRPRRRPGPGSRCRSCCGPGTPARTPPPTTSPSPEGRAEAAARSRAGTRPGRKVLVRVDGAGATHAFLDWLTGQRLSYSVGFGLPDRHRRRSSTTIPEQVWTPAYDAHDQVRDGAWVAELTDLLDLTGWPAGMRVIARKERPHPGAQLRLTDVDGLRVTAFATNTTPRPAAGPGAAAPPPGPRRGPDPHRQGHRPDQPAAARLRPEPDLVRHRRCWPPSSPPGCSCSPCTDHDARRWEPKRLRLRLFTVPAALARTGRRVLLHLARTVTLGPACSPTPSTGSAPSPSPADPQPPMPDHRPAPPGPWNRAHPRRHRGNCHTPDGTIRTQPTPPAPEP